MKTSKHYRCPVCSASGVNSPFIWPTCHACRQAGDIVAMRPVERPRGDFLPEEPGPLPEGSVTHWGQDGMIHFASDEGRTKVAYPVVTATLEDAELRLQNDLLRAYNALQVLRTYKAGLSKSDIAARIGEPAKRLTVPDDWLQSRLEDWSFEAAARQQLAEVSCTGDEAEQFIARITGRYREDWTKFVAKADQPGDEIWKFRSGRASWGSMAGRSGYVVRRQGQSIAVHITAMS